MREVKDMTDEVQHKTTVAEIKRVGDAGSFEAVVATLNVVDSDGDVVVPGALNGKSAHIFPVHDQGSTPLGKVTIEERGNLAVAVGQFNLDVEQARDWHSAIKFDLQNPPSLQEWSWGYRPTKVSFEERDDEMARVLEAIDLIEVSPVPRGAAVGTRTISAKCDECDTKTSGDQESADDEENIDDEVKVDAGDDVESRVEGNDNDAKIDDDEKRATSSHESETSEAPWDGPANERLLSSPVPIEIARSAYAWVDESEIEDGAIPKSAGRFIHHFVSADGDVGAASTRACSTGIAVLNGARGGTTIPSNDRSGVWDHLAGHLRDAEAEPPELRAADDCTEERKLADQVRDAAWEAEAAIARVREVSEQRRRATDDRGRSRQKLSKEVIAETIRLCEASEDLRRMVEKLTSFVELVKSDRDANGDVDIVERELGSWAAIRARYG